MSKLFNRRWFAVIFSAALLLSLIRPVTAQVTPDQAADMLLNSARRAFNEKNYPFAADRFREFLNKYGGHKDAPAARYGLALTLLDGPSKDYNLAIEQLQPLAGSKEFAEHASVLYHLGLAKRGQGLKELSEATAKPNEAAQRRDAANHRFDEAAQQFAAAIAAYAAKARPPAEGSKELATDWEWAARARCDQAEMLLRIHKAKEAQAVAEPFIKDKAILAKSRYRGLGQYYYGSSSLLLKEYDKAGRALGGLAPFSDPIYGTQARYLLARVHHIQDERAEAAADYDSVLTGYAKEKQAAGEALKQPDKFRNDPEQKARLEALTKEPPPDHVARSAFYLGTLRYENGRFAESLPHFAEFIKQHPQSPLVAEAQLRQGFCHVQLKQYAEAIKTLQTLADKNPALADQALLWIAKAQIAAADPNNVQALDQATRTGLDTLRRAAEKAQQLSATDPEAKIRRGEILMELGDTQQIARQFKEAAATYNQVLTEKTLAQRDEEVLQRLTTALHLAGDYAESDKACQRFIQAFPKSTLLPAVLFRHAENAYFTALAAEKNANLPNRATELPKLFDEAGKRYQNVVDKFPDFDHIGLARYGLALSFYRKGDTEKAKDILETIAAGDRTGDLVQVPYVLADCLIRLAPTKADDALAAGKMEEQLKGAVEQLESFIGAQANAPRTPDALLKLGFCHMRLATLFAQKEEKDKGLAAGRAAYEKLIQQFAKHELYPQAVFERAKCLALMNDPNGATNELRRFAGDLKAAPIAPLALLHLSTVLRGQNKATEAAEVLKQARQQHEPTLAKDPSRAGWVVLLQYHHAIALREAGKLPEARALFESIAKQGDRPEAVEAAFRYGQCLKDEGVNKLEAARKKLALPNLKTEEQSTGKADFEAGTKLVRDAVQYLDQQAEQLKAKQPVPEARARMLYAAAWGNRTLAEAEIDAARKKIQQDLWQKVKEEAAKKAAPGKTPVPGPLPDVPLSAVRLQPAELKARSEYQALLDGFPDLPLAADARFELAELHADRSDWAPAVKLLKEALDKEPTPELTDRVRIRLGACLYGQGDAKAALVQFLAVAQNPKGPLAGQAYYRAGECQIQRGEWAETVKTLAVFRNQESFKNVPGLTDHALLQLGFAHGKLNQWDQSRQTYEQLIGRFGSSPWVAEARYGIGWAWQNQKNYDNAVNVYNEVIKATATELGARAQLQIGLCRLEQKRYAEAANALLIVHSTYDYPELNAVSLCEAARCLIEGKQPAQATRLLERVIRDHPESKWAEIAKERLESLKKG
ncbi:MAG: tetratricopeptide repeat protein [Gemmataceae bacterium]